MNILLAQFVGAVGVLVLLATFQFNKRKTILRLQMLAGVVWALHFALLGVHTGAAMNLLMSIRNFFFDRYPRNWRMFWAMMVVIVFAGVLTWQNWTSTLPLAASVIGTIAVWQKNPKYIRLLMIAVPLLWFTHNFANGSYPGMVGDTVTLTSILIGIYRFDIRKRAKST